MGEFSLCVKYEADCGELDYDMHPCPRAEIEMGIKEDCCWCCSECQAECKRKAETGQHG